MTTISIGSKLSDRPRPDSLCQVKAIIACTYTAVVRGLSEIHWNRFQGSCTYCSLEVLPAAQRLSGKSMRIGDCKEGLSRRARSSIVGWQ